MQRRRLIAVSVCGLGASGACLWVFRQPILAYIGIGSLAVATVLYLVPETGGGRSLTFPQIHPFFRYLVRLNFLVSLPLSSVFVYLGLIVAGGQAYGLFLLLAAARILPDLALDRATHRRKRDLLEGTPSTESFSGIGDHDLCKVTGYVHQTRTRYRLWGETVCNVWLVDRFAGKLFLPSVSEIRGVTEPLNEGTRLVAVGPSARGFGITALQPVACAVVPSGWDQGIAEWFDVLWSRSWRRRLLRSTANSALYLIAVAFLSWAISGIVGERPGMLAISLLSGLFLSAYSHKTLRESANYDVSGYFEPRWRTLPEEAKERRLQHLRRLAQSGRVAEEYVHLVETAGDRL